MPYLIFNSKEEAVERNDQAGEAKGLAYHIDNDKGVTRYVWRIDIENTNEPRAALVIDRQQNLLTNDETAALVESLPGDWQTSSDP